jgi:hypothetical protein
MLRKEKEISLLIIALQSYHDRQGNYFPVDESEMQKAIDSVIEAKKKVNCSQDAILARIFSDRDGTEEIVQKLINLATALTDYDNVIHDQLLYVRGNLLR